MKPRSKWLNVVVVSLFLVVGVWAQAPDSANQGAASPAQRLSAAEVPRLIKFSGTLLDAQERPLAGPVGVTFALYAQQTGGATLWVETQNVKPDTSGVYTVLLGANSANGVPAELFVSGEARWLGIQVGQQPEHERILLVSVPYALKAGDAETLGGLPASAFVTTGTPGNTGNAGGAAAATSSSSTGLPKSSAATTPKAATTPQPATPCTSLTSDGTATANSIGLFTAPCNLQGSVITQSSGNVGIGTATPAVALDVVGNNAGLRLSGTGTHQVTVTGATSGRLGQDANGFFFASDTKGSNVRFLTNNGTLNEWMRITSVGNVGIGTATPAAKLDVVGSNSSDVLNVTQNGTGPAATFSGAANHLFDIIGTGGQAQINMIGPQTILTLNSTIAPPNAFSNLTFSHSGIVKWLITTNPKFANVNQLGFIDGSGISRLTLDPTGNATITGNLNVTANVGIGTTTPAATLDVNGNLNLPNTASATVGVISLGGSPFAHNFGMSGPGSNNTFLGQSAGNFTMIGGLNTAVGFASLTNNTTGARNAAVGVDTLLANTTGADNTGVGETTLSSNTSGGSNTAVGAEALFSNTIGGSNTAVGFNALGNNMSGSNNSAFGLRALQSLGFGGGTGDSNVAVGESAAINLTSGSSNIVIGPVAGFALAMGSNNIYIANNGASSESNTIRIGTGQMATFIAGISGSTSGGGVAVFVNSSGQLGTVSSSRRYKHEIADMGGESDLLMKLRPVAFYYKPELDGTQTRQYGLVAEEVAQVAPQLVVYGKDGTPETVRYHFVNAMLLNEVQKQRQMIEEHQRVNEMQRQLAEEQQSTIARQQSEIQDLAARVAKLEALVALVPPGR